MIVTIYLKGKKWLEYAKSYPQLSTGVSTR